MRHLWQRIFLFVLALIFFSQAAVFMLHRYSVSKEEIRRFAAENVLALATAVEGRSPAAADAVTVIFNRRSNRVWLENPEGQVIAGALPAYGSPGFVSGPNATRDNPEILELKSPHGIQHVAVVPVSLRRTEATLFLVLGPPRGPGLWTVFFQGMIAVSIVGVALSLWMAWRVSRPLRTLRDQVLEIAGGDLDKRVAVSGRDEIADVSVAVNQMAGNLARHIRGMRELVANISHEMRSPLARTQVSLALLEEDLAASGATMPQAASRIALIGEELAHLNKLIGATLLSSKLDLQDQVNLTETVAFSGLCAEMCRRNQPVFASRGIVFECAISPHLGVLGDETLLTTLVSNLLDNAAKYTSADGQAVLRLYADHGTALLEVENDHPPMAPEVLDKLFDPFYRAGVATGTGVGLGLSLVGKIAALHSGTATAANTATGVVFQVALPLAAEPDRV